MPPVQKTIARKSRVPRNLWFERIMAVLASINLSLVLFDLSYIPWRDFYLGKLPYITQLYDPIKGIEPHRETQNYLKTVDALEDQVAETGLQSPQVEKLLKDLSFLSTEMVDDNPFAVANKSGTLEKIKNRMRDRLNRESSKQAFSLFWSQAHLSQAGWNREINFFNRQIRPLIETNYYRPLGENGAFIDYFWQIDLPFIIIFGLEFLGRTFYIHRQHASVSWSDAMLWRWYDILLLLPFWRWLRIVPVAIRLDRAQLLDLERVQEQIHQGVVANLAEEITEVVVVQVINQLQGSIQRGEVTRWLFQSEKRPYIDLNNTNEVEAIANILQKLLINQVLPKIKPDLEAILHHNIESILQNLPAYQTLQNIPGLNTLPAQLTEKLVTEISRTAYDALTSVAEDPVGAQLSAQLVQHLGEAIVVEAQNQNTLEKVQTLLSDMLEEIKINYVEQLSQQDVEAIMEQTRLLRQMAHPKEARIAPSRG